jgi:hypothetical protein
MAVMRMWKAITVTAICLVVLYVAFWVLNTQLLASQSATAQVVGKEHRPAGTSYRTEKIGDAIRTIPYAIPEAYILKLTVAGKATQYPVEKEFYDRTPVGATLEVRYEKHRISGGIRVLSVESGEAK